MATLRSAAADDVRRYLGTDDLASDWCIEGRVVGYILEDGSEPIACGCVSWDREGRAWGWFSRRGPVSRFMLHRKALALIALLRQVDEPALYAICNEAVPGAAAWLRRLGFSEAPEMTVENAGTVWVRRLI